MSIDLVVLTPGSATEYDRALRVYYEEETGEPDEPRLQAFADELERRYDEPRPFDEPIVMPTHVLLTIAPRSWEEVVPAIVKNAHGYGLVALDPQEEKLFPPGTPYAVSEETRTGPAEVTMTVHHGDGSIEDIGVVDSASRSRWNPLRIMGWIRRRRVQRRANEDPDYLARRDS